MTVTLADLRIVYFDPKVHNVSDFDCGDADLNDFVKHDAAKYQHDHLSHTRLVFLKGELVGYLTLLADCIILQTGEKKRIIEQHQLVYTFPALKIGRLGIEEKWKHQGIGTELLRYTIGLVVRLNRELNVGCRFITLDAYPKSLGWYQKNGFVLNKHYKDPNRTHPSMRYDILRGPEISPPRPPLLPAN